MLIGEPVDSPCDQCQFTLHCGCCYDDHKYKMLNCDQYALAISCRELMADLQQYIAREKEKST